MDDSISVWGVDMCLGQGAAGKAMESPPPSRQFLWAHCSWQPSEHNINSDLSSKVASTTQLHLSRRGDKNVPLRCLKGAEWFEEGQDFTPSYFATDEDSNLIPVEFDFSVIQWGTAWPCSEGGIYVNKPAPMYLGLQIYDEERADQSQWGPRDGISIEEDTAVPAFQFGSDQGDTLDPDLQIPDSEWAEQEELYLANLAQLIPSYVDKPYIPSIEQVPLLAAQMSQIAATTT